MARLAGPRHVINALGRLQLAILHFALQRRHACTSNKHRRTEVREPAARCFGLDSQRSISILIR